MTGTRLINLIRPIRMLEWPAGMADWNGRLERQAGMAGWSVRLPAGVRFPQRMLERVNVYIRAGRIFVLFYHMESAWPGWHFPRRVCACHGWKCWCFDRLLYNWRLNRWRKRMRGQRQSADCPWTHGQPSLDCMRVCMVNTSAVHHTCTISST